MEKQEYKNISNGNSDGVVIFYMKDGKLHPVALTKDQAIMLDVVIATPFAESKMLVAQTPLEYANIRHMIAD